MKKLALFALTLLSLHVGAQEVKYKILSDDPRHVKPFSLSLDPFYCDLGATDIHMGWQVRADLLFLKRLEFRAEYRRAYLDINESSGESGAYIPSKGVKPASHFEGGVSLFLFDKLKKTNTKLVLSSRTSGNYTYTKYIMIPATKRKMFGVRGGVYAYNVAMEIDGNKNGEFFTVKTEDGNTTLPEGAPDGAITMYTTGAVYGGLHWKSIIDVIARTDYGIRKVGGMSDFYIDVLFSPVVSFGNVRNNGIDYTMEANKDKVKRFGWRAGWQMRHPNKVWFDYKFEFGARPGFKSTEKIGLDSERIYMMFGFGLNIPVGKRKYEKD